MESHLGSHLIQEESSKRTMGKGTLSGRNLVKDLQSPHLHAISAMSATE